MTPRLCLDCGTPAVHARCPDCERTKQHDRNTSRPQYAGTWKRDAKRTVEAWVATHGHVCPGWHRPPHPATDLVCDHVAARDPSAVQVLCRSCNSRKSVAERASSSTSHPTPGGHPDDGQAPRP